LAVVGDGRIEQTRMRRFSLAQPLSVLADGVLSDCATPALDISFSL
jgi:hypothetical protein